MIVDQHKISIAEWTAVIDRDYLRQFLPDGGASVKVVVANASDRHKVCDDLRALSLRRELAYAHVDAARSKLHLVYGLFGEIARQVDWRSRARGLVERLLTQDGRAVPNTSQFSLDGVAEANDEAREIIKQAIRRFLTREVFRDFELSREFRIAAMALCQAVYESDEEIQRLATSVEAWLKGDIERIAAVRSVGIHRKIARANARQMLYSAASWLRKSGSSGLVVTIDFSRYVLGKAALGEGNTYTKATALDMNEVLRQFIDSVDEMSSCLLVFLTAPEFLTNGDRGLQRYDALRLRLTDDVRDRRRPNPLAPLVQLEGAS